MNVIPAGTEVRFRVTYLEMTERPSLLVPPLPGGVRLVRVTDPPVWFFLSMYDAVGRDYEWRNRFEQAERDPDGLTAFVKSPDVEMWVAYANGYPNGFFVLDRQVPGNCELAYFGLVPEAVGGGLGGVLLKTAISYGWSAPGTTRMTVNTCSLDHPRALPLYQKMGFRPIRTEEATRVLFRDRDTSRHPA